MPVKCRFEWVAAACLLVGLALSGCEQGGASESASPVGGAGGVPGSGGVVPGGAGGSPLPGSGGEAEPDAGVARRPDGRFTAPGYQSLAPEVGAPLSPDEAVALSTPAPEGWDWYPIEGTRCRDGSGAGFFLHRGEVEKLVIYLEGGGACLSPGFCAYNPQNVDQILTGDGQTVIGSAFGVVPNRQQPGAYELGVPRGIHELQRPDNPYRGWSQVYVPYCTGDVYAGNKPDAEIEGLPGKQQFVGHMNMRRFVSRWTGTFPAVDTVVLTGSSAGSFGAALNFSMVQDAFAWAQVLPIMDSGLPFTDAHWPPCLQRTFRELWNIDDTLPPDCQGCFQEDGGGLIGLADFLMEKHPTTRLAVMTAAEDEVMRLFFSAGLRSCEGLSISDPVAITLGQFDPNVYIPGPDYAAAIEATWARYQDTGRLAGYVMTGALHQHQFRERFYEAAAGGTTIADFVRAFIAGEVGEVGVSVLAH